MPGVQNNDRYVKPKPTKKIYYIFLILIILMIVLLAWRFTSHSSKKNSKPRPPTVVISKSHVENVPLYLNALGLVTPTDTVTVKTQINGPLLNVKFKEGQMVKKGELLAQIDPRPF